MKLKVHETFKSQFFELLKDGTSQDFYYFAKFADWKNDSMNPEAALMS